MKRIRRLALMTLGLLAALGTPGAAALAAPELRIVGDNWCPYNCSRDEAQPGYLVELIQEILGTHYQVIYTTEPWTRAVKLVESGESHLLLATTSSTTPDLKLSDPVGVDRTCFYVRNEATWRYRKPDDLAGQRLGVIQDYSYDGDGPIDQLIAGYRKEKSPLLELSYGHDAVGTNFRKLEARRMDVLIENENVARYSMRKLYLGNIVRTAGCVSHYQGSLHLGLSNKHKDSAAVLKQINRGIAQWRANGKLATLLQRYGINDWQPLLSQ